MEDTTMDWGQRFDSRFGKPGPEKNSDSIGRIAGCDDCPRNILLRGEHKSFLKEELILQEHRLKELAQQKVLSENALTRERTITEVMGLIVANSYGINSIGNEHIWRVNLDNVEKELKKDNLNK